MNNGSDRDASPGERFELQGRTFVVTAGGSGIGRACARQIARAGGRVGIVDVDGAAARAAEEENRSLGARAVSCIADVRDRAALTAAVARIESELGPLGGAVAAAGISIPEPAASLARASWDAVLGVGLTGCFLTCQIVGRRLIASGTGGSIVAISSTDSIGAHAGRAAYCAAKFGVVGIVRTLAIEWGRHGIRVNAVAPGITDTPAVQRGLPAEQVDAVLVDRTPLGRIGAPDDMGNVAAFLLSDSAAYVTGQNLGVDGGISAGYITRWRGADLASSRLLERGIYKSV